MAKKSNLTRINEEAKHKKEIKEDKKKKIVIKSKKENANNEEKEEIVVKKNKKIKHNFVDDGSFVYADTLILRLTSRSGIVLEECVRKSDAEITRNCHHRIGSKVIYKDGLLTVIKEIIKSEEDLVYVVQEADEETKKKQIELFGDDAFKMNNALGYTLIYRKPEND